MRSNHSNRVVFGLVLIAGIFITELFFIWGVFAYLLAGIFIFTTPGKFVHGLILGIVTAVFIIVGYFYATYPPDQNIFELTNRSLLLFIIALSVVARIRNNSSDSVAGQTVELHSAIAEKEEALVKLNHMSRQVEAYKLDRKLIENELLKGKRLHEAMAHHFPDGVICVLNKDMRYVLADGRGLEALGLHKIDLKGEHATIGSGVELRRAFAGENVSFETTINNDAYTVNAVPIPDKNDEINEILIVIRNISDRKKLESNLFKALEKEKELNLLMSQFVTMASHKFRTPLSTILSSVFLLENNIDAEGTGTEVIF